MKIDLQALAKETFMSPGDAAEKVMALRLPHETLWSAVALVSILNAVIMTLSLHFMTGDDALVQAMPPAFRSPMLLAMFMAGALVITIFMFYWVGRAMGGQAALGDVLALLAWLQFVMLVVQILIEMLVLALPGLVGAAAFIGNIWAFYILVAFLDRAHRFGSPIRAIGVVIFSVGLLSAGVIIFVLLIGAMAGGVG